MCTYSMYVWYVKNIHGKKSAILYVICYLEKYFCIKVGKITSQGHACMIKQDAAVYNTFPLLYS